MRTKLIAAAALLLSLGISTPPRAEGATASIASASAEPVSVADQLALIELTSSHNWAIDSWNPDAYAATFSKDAVLENPRGAFRGRAAIRQALLDYEKAREGNYHHSLNHVITPNADGSLSMVSYFLTIRTRSMSKSREVPYVLSHAVFTDTAVKEADGRWRFLRRVQNPISTRPQPW